MRKKQTRVLADHKKVRSKLIPPALNAMGESFSPLSWTRNIVPELMWIAVLIDRLGLDPAIDLARTLTRAAHTVCDKRSTPMIITASSFLNLSESERVKLKDSISSEILHDLQDALSVYNFTLEENPMGFLGISGNKMEITKRMSEIESLLEELYDRYSYTSTVCMAVSILLGIWQGKIILRSADLKQKLDDFGALSEYPETEHSRAAAASFRAGVLVFAIGKEGRASERSKAWIDQFWDTVSGLGSCIQAIEINCSEPIPDDPLGRLISSYTNSAKTELKERLDHWGFNLAKIEMSEVIGALLARQTTIAVEFASAPAIWTPHSAPLMLRTMADVYITLAWILKEPEERAKKFVDDGLGAVKLELAHRKNS